MTFKIKTKKLKEKKSFSVNGNKIRDDVSVEETTNGFKVLSNYGDVEEGFFSEKKEADDYAKEISVGITSQELHKRVVGTYDEIYKKD